MTLAPYLFAIAVDLAMWQIKKEKRSGLNYADEIVLLSDEIRQARQLLRNGNIECNKDQSYVYQR